MGKDDLITSEGIETSQGVRLKRPPLKSMQDGVDAIHPIGMMDMIWSEAMSSGSGIVSELETGENHKPLDGILWCRLKHPIIEGA